MSHPTADEVRSILRDVATDASAARAVAYLLEVPADHVTDAAESLRIVEADDHVDSQTYAESTGGHRDAAHREFVALHEDNLDAFLARLADPALTSG